MEGGGMMGIGILIFLIIWAGLSLLIALFISKRLLRRFTTNIGTGRATNKGILFILVLSVLVFFAPILDQLIAYPKWQQLCATTGDFEWGPGMDEKKAFGRDYYGESETTQFTIFPNVRVYAESAKLFDANSDELLFMQPHYKFHASAMIKVPDASGGNPAIFLPTCASYGLNGKNYEKTLQLKWVNKKRENR